MQLIHKYHLLCITNIVYSLFISTVVIPGELSGIRDTVLVKKEFIKDSNDSKKVTCKLFFNNDIDTVDIKKIKSNKNYKRLNCYIDVKNFKVILIDIDIIDDEIIIIDFQDAIIDIYKNIVKNIKIEYQP